ncbi:hypothetical protein FJO69_02555 [[Mycoplasma] falconis]|uniref:Uncharacterized protein n=1 Tax=[Mycoplasma] falconis TaxID=92403 RepID=A0A501X960_9BACT|nr:hypothetical protein [[Mycoplasma] falconis]TPE56969.1 hypothetical protein FJO69_02555 [[Mycoplasma] falconis]
MSNKVQLGQFFTISNPFKSVAFYKWWNLIPQKDKKVILEPFAGTNNIPLLISEVGYYPEWKCFDIAKQEINRFDEFNIEIKNTLKDFPKNFKVAITNPPYLARNSATRNKLEFENTPFDDVYKQALKVMLDNCDYVAAIIPETFITWNNNEIKKRLKYAISLTMKMFDDTDCPVCLALFVKEENDSYEIYRNDYLLGNNLQLANFITEASTKYNWTFNDPQGEIGAILIDDTNKDTIKFVKGEDIKNKISVSSRSITRIKIPKEIKIKNLNKFITYLNNYLIEYRENTYDVFMSSFKGLRKDGKYRRRLSFTEARKILNICYENWLRKNN